ncbi:ultraviolet-B receptor UVR8 isoform X7 [Ananas comosus]|uniref:Ultraviolet-B receptor UVR8 isoform X7 n=1 Tax=Ananas comosus TaxID=4615 RepID=A0A6P5GDC7_ANACO|nr:ultraviolet-B receptor UVR8 isoform X7 [Ananas comosus]
MASAFWRSSVRRISKSVLEPLIHRRRWYSSKPRRFAALWGNGDYGRLGLGSLESRWKPTVCPFFRDDHPVSIVCGGAHTLFLTESGRVFATGLNNFGQLGITSSKSHTLVPVEIFGLPEKVVEISAGYHHSCAITDNGKLFVWGDNSSGQLGLGRKAGKTVSSPTKVDCLVDVTVRMAALGAEHSIVVTDEGNVLSWGAGGAGRLGHGHQSSILGFYVSSSECTPRLIKYFDAIKVKENCTHGVQMKMAASVLVSQIWSALLNVSRNHLLDFLYLRYLVDGSTLPSSQVEEFSLGVGEVLMEHSLKTATLLEDNWGMEMILTTSSPQW